MDDYEPVTSFGEDMAEIYDEVSQRGDEEAAATFLADLAAGGPVLELAVGTGRIALPLAACGVHVDGIDFSPEMVDQLRAKPGGEAIQVTIGDFADVSVDGSYRLVYLVFNTLFNLLTQDDQVRCFQNVADHLTEDGAFVVEAAVPTSFIDPRDEQYVRAESVGVDEVRLDIARHDPVAQTLDETHVSLTSGDVRLHPIVTRYAWPSELDLMARIAGLRLRDRWGGWNREPFTAASRGHVSVFTRR